MPVDWSLDEIIQANRKKARDSKQEQKSYKRKVISKPYSGPVPKGNIGGRWEHDLFQDNPARSRLSCPDTRTLKQFKDVHKRRNEERREFNFLDRLADDTDFQREQIGKRELQSLDNDLDFYMKRKVPVDWSSNEAVPKGRKKVREAQLEHNFRVQKVISECYVKPKPKKIVEGHWDGDLYVDLPIQSRLSYPEQATGIKKRAKKGHKEYNFLDRLADDKEFQREQKEKRELQDLDHELDAYMKRSKSLH